MRWESRSTPSPVYFSLQPPKGTSATAAPGVRDRGVDGDHVEAVHAGAGDASVVATDPNGDQVGLAGDPVELRRVLATGRERPAASRSRRWWRSRRSRPGDGDAELPGDQLRVVRVGLRAVDGDVRGVGRAVLVGQDHVGRPGVAQGDVLLEPRQRRPVLGLARPVVVSSRRTPLGHGHAQRGARGQGDRGQSDDNRDEQAAQGRHVWRTLDRLPGHAPASVWAATARSSTPRVSSSGRSVARSRWKP